MDGTDDLEELYVFGPFSVDPLRRRLTHGGESLVLTPTVFAVLLHLVERPGRIVTKDELLDAVWQGRTVEEANVKQAVFTLRRTLGSEGSRIIVTAPGRGYRFAVEVRRQSRDPAPPVAESVTLPPARAGRIWPWFAAIGLAGIAVSGAFLWAGIPTTARAGRTVLLADFDNRTGDPVFDRSLGNLLRVDLSQSPYLTVISDKQAQATLALMTRPDSTPVTGPVAVEICTRDNGDTVIQGGLAKFGGRYLVTLSATDCATGEEIAATKAEVVGREAVIPAVDGLIDRVRAKLGESRKSIRTFDAPLLPEKTASLDALKVFSDAKWRFDHGRMMDAIPLAQHAVDLDPQFAAGYTLLAVSHLSMNDPAKAKAALEKAYALRSSMSERGRIQIAALRAQFVTHDYDAAISAMRLQTAIYSREPVAWSNLANAEDFIGEHAQAVADGKRAVALHPTLASPYVVLARAQLGAGQLADADATARLAIARGFTEDGVHRERLRIALALGDAAGVAREKAWANTADAPKVWEVEAEYALAQGRVREAKAIFSHLSQVLTSHGEVDWAAPPEARLLATLGYGLRAIPPMKPPTGAGEGERDYLWTQARVGAGDGAATERTIEDLLRANPEDTLLRAIYAPEIRASLALRRQHAADAIGDLAPALAYAARDLDIHDLLGDAYLAAGDGPRAAAAFRANLAHPYWAPGEIFTPLAKLGLARALSLQGDRPGALREYKAVLADWKNADPDVPVIEAAKAEYRRLTERSA